MNFISAAIAACFTFFALLISANTVYAQSQFNSSGDLKSTGQYWADKRAEEARNKQQVTPAPSTAISSGRIVLFRAFRERSRDNKISRQINKEEKDAKERKLELDEWKKNVLSVIANFKSGNVTEASDIMQSIQQQMPGLADNLFQSTYNYFCILIMRETGDHNGVIALSNANPEILNGLPNAFPGCSISDALLLKSIYTDALHHVNGIEQARSNWKKVADNCLPYINRVEKEKSAVVLCYNIIAMQQFKMGVFEDGKLNILRQLALYPENEKIEFEVYQNIIEFIVAAPGKNKRLVDFCLQGLEKIRTKSTVKNTDAAFQYALDYNKAALLRVSGDLDKAEMAIKSIKTVSADNQFEYNLLKGKILMGQINLLNALIIIPTEREKRRDLYASYTPAQKHEFDSLDLTNYFNNLQPDYMNILFNKMIEESKIHELIQKDYLELSAAQRQEIEIYNAESNIQTSHSYDMASMSYEIFLIGDENNWVYLLRLAQIKILQKNYKAAVDFLKKAIVNNPVEYELDIALGDIYHHYTNEPKKAKENYSIALIKGAFLPDSLIAFLGVVPVQGNAISGKAGTMNAEYPATFAKVEGRTYSLSDAYPTFYDGMAMIRKNGFFGYIDMSGKEVIAPVYHWASRFYSGKAVVELNFKFGIIDNAGNIVVPIIYQSIIRFLDGLATVKLNNKWGFIDDANNTVIPFEYDEAGGVNENRARVNKNGKWGLVDKTNKVIIPLIYDGLGTPEDGISHARLKDKWGYIDMKGQTVIEFRFQMANSFKNGLAAIKDNGKWGFIDKSGRIIIPALYEEVMPFSDDLAAVMLDGKWGFVNKSGTLVIQAKYNSTMPFEGGAAPVKMGYKWGFINTQGIEIVPVKYSYADFQINSLRVVEWNDQSVYFDKTGKQISQ